MYNNAFGTGFSGVVPTLINSHERFDFPPNLELDFQMFQLMCSPFFGGLKIPPKKVGTQLQVSFLSPML